MKIEHVAIYVNDLEQMRLFYTRYFGMESSSKYVNTQKRFSSYFLSFNETSARIEIMCRPDIAAAINERGHVLQMGAYCHFGRQ